jgi:hypothetical protein
VVYYTIKYMAQTRAGDFHVVSVARASGCLVSVTRASGCPVSVTRASGFHIFVARASDFHVCVARASGCLVSVNRASGFHVSVTRATLLSISHSTIIIIVARWTPRRACRLGCYDQVWVGRRSKSFRPLGRFRNMVWDPAIDMPSFINQLVTLPIAFVQFTCSRFICGRLLETEGDAFVVLVTFPCTHHYAVDPQRSKARYLEKRGMSHFELHISKIK